METESPEAILDSYFEEQRAMKVPQKRKKSAQLTSTPITSEPDDLALVSIIMPCIMYS